MDNPVSGFRTAHAVSSGIRRFSDRNAPYVQKGRVTQEDGLPGGATKDGGPLGGTTGAGEKKQSVGGKGDV